MTSAKPDILKSFRTLPGVGKSIAEDPETMYLRLEELAGKHVDRCEQRDPHLEKWWSWKD